MKKIAIWGTTFIVFVIIRIILGEVGVYHPGERVGGFLDIFIFLILLSLSRFLYGFVYKDKEQNETDTDPDLLARREDRIRAEELEKKKITVYDLMDIAEDKAADIEDIKNTLKVVRMNQNPEEFVKRKEDLVQVLAAFRDNSQDQTLAEKMEEVLDLIEPKYHYALIHLAYAASSGESPITEKEVISLFEKIDTLSLPQSDEGLTDNVYEKAASESEPLGIVEPKEASVDYDVKEVDEIQTNTLSSETDFMSTRKEDSPPLIPSQLQNDHSLFHININLGRDTLFVTIVVLILVIICSSIIIYHNTTQSNVSSEETEMTTPPSYENDEERWDAENGIYANFKYGIAFNLPHVAWHKISGTAKHTVVKFVQPETQLTIFVNIRKVNADKQIDDIWEIYDEYVRMLPSILQSVNVNSEENIIDYHFQKAEFCGKHAIKLCYQSEIEDDRYKEKNQITTKDYSFIHNHGITTVSIKCYDDVLEAFLDEGVTLEDFLKGFHLTPISEKYIQVFE